MNGYELVVYICNSVMMKELVIIGCIVDVWEESIICCCDVGMNDCMIKFVIIDILCIILLC